METDLSDLIIAYENGDTNLTQEIKLFAKLVETGQAWALQGHYGRLAQEMIDLERNAGPSVRLFYRHHAG